MALSDCVKCWDTPCTCGWEYRGISVEYLQKKIDMYNKMIQFKLSNPKAKFSTWGEHETEDDIAFMKFIGSRK